MTRISQREARRLRTLVAHYEEQTKAMRRIWAQEYPGGVEITRCAWTDATAQIPTAVRTARKLGHAVVAIGDDGGTVRFVALPLPESQL